MKANQTNYFEWFNTHVFSFHDVAALTNWSYDLVGVGDHSLHFWGHRPWLAVAATGVRRDEKLDAIRDGHFASVAWNKQIKLFNSFTVLYLDLKLLKSSQEGMIFWELWRTTSKISTLDVL
jgi:hypothetical protein